MKKLFLFFLFFASCSPLFYTGWENQYVFIFQRTPAEQASAIKYMKAQSIPDSHIKNIVNGKVEIGYTYNEVTWAIGDPDETNTTQTANSTYLQCIYNYGDGLVSKGAPFNTYYSYYYYFENNVLTTIQN